MSITALHRSQWVGLDGAPNTQTLNINSPITDKVGVGLSVVNDEIGNGTNQETYIDGVFSFSIPVSRFAKISFGFQASAHLLNIDFSKLQQYNNEAQTLGLSNIDNKFSPNFGAGVYYHNDTFYAGVSIPNFLETKHFDDSATGSSFLAEERMNFYLISGYVFDLNPRWKFKPATLVKIVTGAPIQFDMSANFMLNDKFVFGAAYRWDASVSALFNFNINEKFMLGLAYDRETTELGGARFNDGSFEVLLRYEFSTRFRRVIEPRFF